MDRIALQQLRDLPIEGVAERLGLEVRHHKALCPFHNDHHPSLSFNVRKNTYRCFVCDAHGGTIDLVMHHLHKDFKEACQWLSLTPDPSPVRRGEVETEQRVFDASRYEKFFDRPYLSAPAKAFLFDQRRLDPRVIRWCRLTSWRDRQGTDWLQIPYYDRDGKLAGLQNRLLSSPLLSGEGLGERPLRFRFPKGAQCGIYNLPVLNKLEEGEALYIAEGCSDCWALLSAGHKAIAIPSATLLKPNDMQLLETLNMKLETHFHMFPDRDLPGERLFLQLRNLLPNLQHHHLPPSCKDYSDYFVKVKRNGELNELNECGREPVDNAPCPAGRNLVNLVNSDATQDVRVRVGDESCKSAADAGQLQANYSNYGQRPCGAKAGAGGSCGNSGGSVGLPPV